MATRNKNGKRKKDKALILMIVSIIMLIIIGISLSTWILVGGIKKPTYFDFGPREVTYFSQMPIPWIQQGGQPSEYDGAIDSGFNEYAFKGARDYSEFKNKKLKQDSTLGLIATSSFQSDGSKYADEMEKVMSAGSNITITAGFNGGAAVQEVYSDQNAKYIKEHRSIVIDDTSVGTSYDGSISVTFDAADVSFLAGLAASAYVTSELLTSDEASDDLVLWGGAAYNTVFDWMSGFEQGVNYFNYKVLGYLPSGEAVGTYDDTFDDAHKSWAIAEDNTVLQSRLENDGLDISNGYTTSHIDYTQPFVNATNDLVSDVSFYNPETSWYTGAFDADYTIAGSSAQNAKRKIEQANENGSILAFPIAGAQTLIASGTEANTIGAAKDFAFDGKIIGVDVDGSKSDAKNSDKYLGSATKNIQDSTSLSIWYADQYMNGNESTKNVEFDDIKAENFIKPSTDELGWDATAQYSGAKGKVFKGTYENGGVDFIGGDLLNKSWSKVYNEIKDNKEASNLSSFDSFLAYAYAAQDEVGGIENASETFTIQTAGLGFPKTRTKGGVNTPWIPDWTVYKNTAVK